MKKTWIVFALALSACGNDRISFPKNQTRCEIGIQILQSSFINPENLFDESNDTFATCTNTDCFVDVDYGCTHTFNAVQILSSNPPDIFETVKLDGGKEEQVAYFWGNQLNRETPYWTTPHEGYTAKIVRYFFHNVTRIYDIESQAVFISN